MAPDTPYCRAASPCFRLKASPYCRKSTPARRPEHAHQANAEREARIDGVGRGLGEEGGRRDLAGARAGVGHVDEAGADVEVDRGRESHPRAETAADELVVRGRHGRRRALSVEPEALGAVGHRNVGDEHAERDAELEAPQEVLELGGQQRAVRGLGGDAETVAEAADDADVRARSRRSRTPPDRPRASRAPRDRARANTAPAGRSWPGSRRGCETARPLRATNSSAGGTSAPSAGVSSAAAGLALGAGFASPSDEAGASSLP